jgi:hypothetical protein
MKKVCIAVSAATLMVTALAPVTVSAAPDNVKISDRPYVRHDGGTDPAIDRCSTSNLLQNEPTATIAPHNARLMTSGANDYCAVTVFGGAWTGFYYSSDAGGTWTNSLLPGYPTDTSAEGQASPLFGFVSNAGDPVQAWDNDGHVYYAGISFARTNPLTGAVWVARYKWTSGATPDYEFTTLPVGRTPQLQFDDKILLEVDRGANSRHTGNVYACWVRFKEFKNTVQLARSTDGGRTFTTQAISGSTELSQFCDIAVTRTGDVYVGWRRYADTRADGTTVVDGIEWAKSTDGGASFTAPRTAATIIPWEPRDGTVDPVAYGKAKLAYCQAADGTRGGCNNNGVPQATAGDCGDGPFACKSGYVFSRVSSQVRIAADPTKSGRGNEVYLAYNATVPGSQTTTGTTYATDASGLGGQGAVYLIRTGNGGQHWSSPARIDPQRKGHQFFADITADSGALHAVWQDSRSDTASGPPSTPSGGDFRTVPISNRWMSTNPPGGVSTGRGVHTFYATSSNGAKSWDISRVSTVESMPQYEVLGNRDATFFGDYNYVAALGKTVFMAWTDHRDVVPGTDPRYPADGTDGFDVHQCRAQQPDGTFGPDTCPFDGGNDQNIYGYVIRR